MDNTTSEHQNQQQQFLIAEALRQLETTLLLLPLAQKTDYLRAKLYVPQLVELESNALVFLRRYDFDTAVAALAIVKYWKNRCEIFGERAFLPLTIVGNSGALTEEDIDFLRSGFCVFLPKDASGRTVLCTDMSRRLDQTAGVRLRVGFYIRQVLSENPLTQTEGFVALGLLHEPKQDQVTRQGFQMVLESCRLHSTHTVNCSLPWNCAWVLLNFVRIVKFFTSVALLPSHRSFLYPSQKSDQLLQVLDLHGLQKRGLPTAIGGTWTYEHDFPRWFDERARIEQERYFEPRPSSDTTVARMPQPVPSSQEATNRTLAITEEQSPAESSANDGALQRSNLNQLNHALRILPLEERSAYEQAQSQCPQEVWSNENRPSAFLRVENRNPWLSARRILRYWKLRSDTCGSPPLPLHQTADGCFKRNDLYTLHTGFINLLPKDEHGCPVIWIDGSRLPEEYTPANWNVCLFYMFLLLTEEEESQKRGVVVLLRFTQKNPSAGSIDTIITFVGKLAFSLPLRIKAVHLVSRVPIPSEIKTMVNFGNSLFVHVGKSHELSESLQKHGLLEKNLPKTLHGEWGYEKFVQWQELRTRMEWKVPLGLSGRNEASCFPAIRSTYEVLPDSMKNEHGRRLNAIHSKRKRDRHRVERGMLQCEMHDLAEEQIALRKENEDLESLVQTANTATNPFGQ